MKFGVSILKLVWDYAHTHTHTNAHLCVFWLLAGKILSIRYEGMREICKDADLRKNKEPAHCTRCASAFWILKNTGLKDGRAKRMRCEVELNH